MELDQKQEFERYILHTGEKFLLHDKIIDFIQNEKVDSKPTIGSIPKTGELTKEQEESRFKVLHAQEEESQQDFLLDIKLRKVTHQLKEKSVEFRKKGLLKDSDLSIPGSPQIENNKIQKLKKEMDRKFGNKKTEKTLRTFKRQKTKVIESIESYQQQ